jgi:hypothetical protein
VLCCAVLQVMTKICREAEASLDYYAMFKNILKQAPLPMSPLESLASSAVRTAHKVGGSRQLLRMVSCAPVSAASPCAVNQVLCRCICLKLR